MYKLDAHLAKAIDRHRKHHPRVTIGQIINSFARIARKLQKGVAKVARK